MEAVSETDQTKKIPFEYDREEEIFIKTFTVFDRTLKEKAFCYANSQRTVITLGFSVYHFEAFSIGIQAVLDRIEIDDAGTMARLTETFTEIKKDPEFYAMTTGGGRNSRGQLQARIGFVENALNAVI
jgi:hypothetical protein